MTHATTAKCLQARDSRRGKMWQATDKALAGEMIMGEVIFSFAVVPVMAIAGCILLYCFLKGN